MNRSGYFERRLIALGALVLAIFNIFLAVSRAPFEGYGQWRHIVAMDVLNGSRFALVILAMLLIAVVPGLVRGKRVAWLLALGCAAASAIVHPLKNIDLWGTGASVLLLGALLGARPQFPARSDPPRATAGLWTMGLGALGVFLYALLGLYFMEREFRHTIAFGEAVSDAVRLMFIVPATHAEPRTHHAVWFMDSVRLAFILVIVAGITQLVAPVVAHASVGRAERDRVRGLLAKYGRSSLAHFALLPDKSYFFSGDREAVLAYKVTGTTAVVMGDPIGDTEQFGRLIDDFIEHCRLDGWAWAFHQVAPECLLLYTERGMRSLKIGEEAVVDVSSFSLAGTSMKHLRATMNRFAREGYRAELLHPPHDRALMARLRAISDEWLQRGQRRERTFTLGQFDEAALSHSQILVARATDGEIVGFADIVPSYHSGQGNFDMLRYVSEPKDIADFLHISLIELFRTQGCQTMTLGMAPFSGLDVRGMDSASSQAMRLFYRYGTAIFRYRGLREYKEKFRPSWEPRYVVYATELQLPGIALAVARVGELRRHASPALRVSARHPELAA